MSNKKKKSDAAFEKAIQDSLDMNRFVDETVHDVIRCMRRRANLMHLMTTKQSPQTVEKTLNFYADRFDRAMVSLTESVLTAFSISYASRATTNGKSKKRV